MVHGRSTLEDILGVAGESGIHGNAKFLLTYLYFPLPSAVHIPSWMCTFPISIRLPNSFPDAHLGKLGARCC